MLPLPRLLILPSALISLILNQVPTVTAQELPWPYNLPPHVKYHPEDEALIRRSIEIQHKLQGQKPIGVRKMSDDPGQKFFLDYWEFREAESRPQQCANNASITTTFDAPLKPHGTSEHSKPILPRILGGWSYEKRDFQCPTGSEACTSIGRPDSCCATGSTCQLVQDIGLGDVGCCPANQVCGGSVSTCPAGGYTDCPQNPGGGCCLPGYACYDVGCAVTSTAIVTVVPPSTTSSTPTPTSISSIPPSTVTQTTTTIVAPPAISSSSTISSSLSSTSSSSVSTATSTSSIVTTITTVTSTASSSSSVSTSLVCSSNFRSCPASLGGGCCPTDQACASGGCSEISSTGSFSAPGRLTSSSASVTSTSTATSFSSISGAGCPTGFYACSAYYGGGCCQTGRDCAVTSCPTTASITVVGESTLSVIAQSGSGITTVNTLLTGACASGWTTCAANIGGGCCPSGYACGTACSATATGGQGNQVGKIAPLSEAGQTLPLERKSTLALLMIFVALVLLT